MVFNQFYRRLYVADQRDAAIAVIDTNSNQLLRPIALGANPLGLTAIQ
jgi:YVTN family beta-propeller protein